jgi:hypothetical protein
MSKSRTEKEENAETTTGTPGGTGRDSRPVSIALGAGKRGAVAQALRDG